MNQLPALFSRSPAGFVLEQDELLTVAFWSCFSLASISKGREYEANRSPLTGCCYCRQENYYCCFCKTFYPFLMFLLLLCRLCLSTIYLSHFHIFSSIHICIYNYIYIYTHISFIYFLKLYSCFQLIIDTYI